jgi:hypothetical protein
MNKDKELLMFCTSLQVPQQFEFQDRQTCEFPLDDEIIELLKKVNNKISNENDDYEIFKHLLDLKDIWVKLIEKSIKCLRYFDTREPFLENEGKNPLTYGIDDLSKYYDKYIDFERILYGSSKYYRDHVVHVFRTWLSGVECMLKNSGAYMNQIIFADQSKDSCLNNHEKISIWTLIALTHDLGYPLEKAKEVIDNTQYMLSSFISNPNVSMDLSFHGVQNNMNDFIVRLMSSKMVKKDTEDSQGDDKPMFVARLQPKYYFKFQKSLERSAHGMISTIVIYKLLTYFLESDYNIAEDYFFKKEDSRQFYIRREILRSIASHTCDDIYHMHMESFAFLLIVMDDCQEWGRKCISELYAVSEKRYELTNIDFATENKKKVCEIQERFMLSEEISALEDLLRRLKNQCLSYIKIFRDGQETNNRDFIFRKQCKINYRCSPKIELTVIFEIPDQSHPHFTVNITYTGTTSTDDKIDEKFFKDVYGNDIKYEKNDHTKKAVVSVLILNRIW